MSSLADFVPTAEAAFIAGVSDRDMNRVVDEHLIPEDLFNADDGRRFSPLAAVMACFYFSTEDDLQAGLRKSILKEVTSRLSGKRVWRMSLKELPRDIDLVVTLPYASIDFTVFVHRVNDKLDEVAKADELVTTNPDVMGGAPVFHGTRVPIENVLASLDEGMTLAQVREHYPFVTDDLVTAARVYQRVHPRRGRPKRLGEANPNWKLRESKVLPRERH